MPWRLTRRRNSACTRTTQPAAGKSERRSNMHVTRQGADKGASSVSGKGGQCGQCHLLGDAVRWGLWSARLGCHLRARPRVHVDGDRPTMAVTNLHRLP
jgi:hypothetical protein